jgi:molybdenum cofactor guanylyltransferase
MTAASERRLPTYILSGGRSSRFGSDKARAIVRGEPLLVHIARVATPHASSLSVVAACEGQYDDLGLRTIADPIAGQGPLGGLHAALSDTVREGWLLLLAGDWLGLRSSWIETLLAHRREDAAAVAFRGEVWEPLLALYHTCLRHDVAARIARGPSALWRLLEESASIPLPLPVDWRSAIPVNTPEDLRRFLEGPSRGTRHSPGAALEASEGIAMDAETTTGEESAKGT